jgi:hypothetical protein
MSAKSALIQQGIPGELVAGLGPASWLEGTWSNWAWLWKGPEMVLDNEAGIECQISLVPAWAQSQPGSEGQRAEFARGNRRGSYKSVPNYHRSNMATQVVSWPALAWFLGWRDRGPIGLGSGKVRKWSISTKLELMTKLAWSQHGRKARQEARARGQNSRKGTGDEAIKAYQISSDPTWQTRWVRGRC